MTDKQLKGLTLLITLGGILIAGTSGAVAAGISLQRKVDRQEWLDTLAKGRLRDTLEALQQKALLSKVDTVLEEQRKILRKVCGDVPRGKECT